MSLAAASLLNGDLDGATAALASVDPKKLDEVDVGHFDALSGLVKDGHRAAYSSAIAAVGDGGSDSVDQAKTAANEAGKLVAYLQKTDSSNTAEISEAKLKQANALLVGNNYRQAEKVLNGVDEKTLDADQQQYLDGMRDLLHGQQIQSLADSCQHQMQQKNWEGAASDAKALTNDLVKYRPDDKDRIVAARMQLATGQIMSGDMEGARKTLGRVPAEHLQNMSEGIQNRFRALNGAVTEHFATVKKEKELQAEQAELKGQLNTITNLVASGDKASAQKAVGLAGKLVADLQKKHPDNADAIAAAKLTLADAKIAAGDTAGGKADLEKISAESNTPAVKEQAQFLQGRAELKENHLGKGLHILQDLSENGKTPELRDTAKRTIASVEADHLRMVDQKATIELDNLHRIDNEKTGFFSMPAQPYSAVDRLKTDDKILRRTAEGTALMEGLMRRAGLTVADFQKMSQADLAKLTGEDNAKAIELALTNPDVKLIAQHHLQGGELSWQNNSLYVDPSYLDSSFDKVSQWVGDRVRGGRKLDEEWKSSDHLAVQALGYTCAFVTDRVSDANAFVKEKLKTAADFYNDPERKDTWYAKIGRAATTAGDVLASTFTMPATAIDSRVDDKERSGAIIGSALMLATMGALKGSGRVWRTAGNYAGRASARIAASDAAQWIANTEFGRLAGKGVQYLERGAGKVGEGIGRVDAKLADSTFGKTVDKVRSTLNPVIRAKKFVQPKNVDEFTDGLVAEKTPDQLRAEVTDADVDAKREALRKSYVNPNRYSEDDLRRMVLGDRIYAEQYNPVGEPKPSKITQSDYERQLSRYEPSGDDPSWNRRVNRPQPREVPNVFNPEWAHGAEVRRFYFNVKPDRAAELADYLSNQLNARDMKFLYKMPNKIGKFNRSDSGVLYVQKADYQTVKEVVQRYAKAHPDAFAEGSPAFTKPIAKGVSAADEPVQEGLPPTHGGHSFGSARSDIIAEAILQAPAGATKEELRALVRQRLREYGFDPDKPWLKQGATVDDL
jgi:hypothetical protein